MNGDTPVSSILQGYVLEFDWLCRLVKSYVTCAMASPFEIGVDGVSAILLQLYWHSGTVDCFDLNDDPHGMGGWDWQI
ncbi:unnamed protein product [Urochloa humidicola]